MGGLQNFSAILGAWESTFWLSWISHSQKKGYRNSTPGVLLLQIAPFFSEGAFFPVCQKKSTPMHRSFVWKQSEGYQNSTKTPLRVPHYGQPISSPRGAVSAPFFLSAESNWVIMDCEALHSRETMHMVDSKNKAWIITIKQFPLGNEPWIKLFIQSSIPSSTHLMRIVNIHLLFYF